MLIVVIEARETATYPRQHPSIVLNRDPWDDYGYRTTFNATFFRSPSDEIELGRLKILRFGQTSGPTPLPDRSEDGLPSDFASMGVSLEYYEEIARLPEGAEILKALRDLATDDEIHASAVKEEAFEVSLLRMAPARAALQALRNALATPEAPVAEGEAPSISDDEGPEAGSVPRDEETPPEIAPPEIGGGGTAPMSARVREHLEAALSRRAREVAPALNFTYTPSSAFAFVPEAIVFDFAGPDLLPNRLIALVGPNGTGKTTLLSNLALAVFEVGGRDRMERAREVGAVQFRAGMANEVVFVSYSAYDSFEMPASSPAADQDASIDPAQHLAAEGYAYVGLRRIQAADPGDSKARPLALKSIEAIEAEFAGVIASLRKQPDRLAPFVQEIRRVFAEPSVAKIHPLPGGGDRDAVVAHLGRAFASLSTGHKAIINIIASLSLHLKPDTLVLLDEPEAHLHPPLIALLLSSIRNLLEAFGAFAIVATHSPVVIQETLGRHVIILDRAGNETRWEVATFETYGENIAAITKEAFGLTLQGADFVSALDALVGRGLELPEIEALFPRRMSSSARAQVIRALSRQRRLGGQ